MIKGLLVAGILLQLLGSFGMVSGIIQMSKTGRFITDMEAQLSWQVVWGVVSYFVGYVPLLLGTLLA